MGNPRNTSRLNENDNNVGTSAQISRNISENEVQISNLEPPPYESISVASLNYGPQDRETFVLHQEYHPDERAVGESSCNTNESRMIDGQRRNHRTEEHSRWMRVPPWTHKSSATFACITCVLGMSNISRFSLLVYVYKACFIVQFLILSTVIGIPLLYLFMALGQYMGIGLLDMWKISPAFKGLGFSYLYIYIALGTYNAVPLSWMFVYFKDSFITLKDSYKWGKCHDNFARNGCLKALNSSSADYYGWSVPSYFHGKVLGRRPEEYFGELNFEVAFNLCLTWLIVFLCLSRGPKTVGKIVYFVGSLPIVLLILVGLRMGQQWSDGIIDLFSSPWKSVFMDSAAWLLAAREVFIIWGLMAGVVLHICSHNKLSTNVTRILVPVVLVTVSTLIVGALLFACIANLLANGNLSFIASSYEKESFVQVLTSGFPKPENFSVINMIWGEGIVKVGDANASGYQVLRLATEVFPSALAVEGVRSISSFWSICFYTSMIMFGLGQQIVLWFCVVESIIAINYKLFKVWHTTTTFISCNIAFLLGLPITSNAGISILHFLDFSIGSLWWITALYLILIFVILFIRGSSYGTEQLVKTIIKNTAMQPWILSLLILHWNLILPVALMVLTTAFLRHSTLHPSSVVTHLMEKYQFWPSWTKGLSLGIQIFPLIILIAVCSYQIFRILVSKKHFSIIERIQLLCCPALPLPRTATYGSPQSAASPSNGSRNNAYINEPPPKYTPPPSYSTATSRAVAKRFDTLTTSFSLDSLDDGSNVTEEEMLTMNIPSGSFSDFQ